MLKPRRPRTQPIFDFDLEWLSVMPGWWWAAAVVGGGVALVVAVVVAAL